MHANTGNGEHSSMSTPLSFGNQVPPPLPGLTQPPLPQQILGGPTSVSGGGGTILPNTPGILNNSNNNNPGTMLPQVSQGEGAQQFCLRWNSYPATVATQLAALRAAEDFVDVTLACDGRQLLAHQLVLSACSPYFMQLFKSTPCQHPVIFLRDVGFRQLVALLEFMYAGEVNVSQVELPALLRTAEALQVRGLADTTANNNNNINNPLPPQQQQLNKPHPTPTFSPHYGQIVNQSVMNNPSASQQQMSQDQIQNQSLNSSQVLSQQISNPAIVSPPVTTTSAPCSSNSGISPLNDSTVPQIKRDRHSISSSLPGGGPEMITKQNADDEDSESNDSNDFDMMDQTKPELYSTEDGNISNQLEDTTGEVFPDDPNINPFNIIPTDALGAAGMDNQSEEEEDSEEDSNEDDGECTEFTYQSDASYSQEGMGEPEPGNINPNGENIPGPSGLGREELPGSGGNGDSKDGPGGSGTGSSNVGGNGGSSGRNRLSRSLWPPGIPYHGPQQCPYCPRILSNVGNWRKHVLTMHFAREKVHKCIHCASSFRTPEYLQKHYVRVHNYPQKMTRRKYVEQT